MARKRDQAGAGQAARALISFIFFSISQADQGKRMPHFEAGLYRRDRKGMLVCDTNFSATIDRDNGREAVERAKVCARKYIDDASMTEDAFWLRVTFGDQVVKELGPGEF